MGFLSGDTEPVLDRLDAEMRDASDALQFERAARLRDRIAVARKAAEAQQMVSERPEDFDVIGIAEDPLEASVQIFHVRRGRVVGHRGFVAEKVEDLSAPEFMGLVLGQVYGAVGTEVPRRVLVPEPPADLDLLCSWLSTMREGPVDIAVPQRGAKRALQETVTRSAAEDLARHRLRRASDHNARSKALTELQAALGLREAPLRIECFDMSHLQGTDYVGSMVVLEDGLVKRSDYRRFKVKTVKGNDDYAAMEEVLTRRLTALKAPEMPESLEAPAEPEIGVRARPRRFAYRPNLLVVDGGKGQLAVAETGGRRARPGRRDRAGVVGQAIRGGLPPRLARTRSPAAWVRCALPPPAGPGRGPPLRHHLPPGEEGQAHDEERAGRHSWAGTGPQGTPDQGIRRGQRGAVGRAGGVAGPLVAARPGGARGLRGRAQDWGPVSEFLVVTGMSGAGRSTAAASLEDLGWFVIDNLPAALILKMAEMMALPGAEIDRVALVIGRGGGHGVGASGSDYFDDLPDVLDALRANSNRVRVLFLDASDDVLIRRYEGTRRRHPLVARGVEESIADERRLLAPVRDRADLLIDTGELNSNQLRTRVLEAFGDEGGGSSMRTSVVSFGYKFGLPLDVDVVFDCRFLPNPFWIEELRPHSGLDAPVRDYVLSQPETKEFLDKVDGLLTGILPSFEREGKSYLTIGLGCTGGRHRSVALAEALGERFVGHGYPVSVFHRDVDR